MYTRNTVGYCSEIDNWSRRPTPLRRNIQGTLYLLANLLPALSNYEGWNFNSGNYLFTTDTK